MPIPRIVIAGAPNAGKSTLFNRLVGHRRALVHPMPGMTRDINESECDWDGIKVILADTGGLLPPGETALVRDVRAHVLNACAMADVIVFLVDGRSGLGLLEEDLSRLMRQAGRPVVLAINKMDDPARMDPPPEFSRLGFEHSVVLSAEHGIGMGSLREQVSDLLPLESDPPLPSTSHTSEIRLAIAGRPNVGKSSLLNALLGQDRSIVSNIPGTTRDAVDALLEEGDRLYRIVDTAGIRRQGKVTERPESLSVMQARRNVESSDLSLMVMDLTEAPTQQDLHVAGIAIERHRPFIVILNKWDLRKGELKLHRGIAQPEDVIESVRGRLKFAPWAPVLALSAITGEGLSRVLPMVARVYDQAHRRVTTGRLNQWLQKAVEAHRPGATRGHERRFYYAAQKGVNPPSFVFFTSPAGDPHFSYQRYLENSLRATFELDLTPVAIEYRQKPRRSKESRQSSKGQTRRPV